ncbi:MAG: chloride channel protein [Deltaproteobacteria bacterium]|nr:chloride channel protein [Deltaproteobacteria bacterium]
MKRRLKEEAILFVSTVKWIVLASVIGLIVGASTAVFLKALNGSIAYAARYPYFFLLAPAGLVLSAVMTKKLAPEAGGYGAQVIEAVNRRFGRIDAVVVPVKFAATVITIALGGSAGKEGPCVQIGAGLSSLFAGVLRFSDGDRKKLVICGISGSFAAVFGTPIAGAIYGIEILTVGSIMYEVLLPSFVAGIVGYQVSSVLGITYFYYPLKFAPLFSEIFFIKVAASGIFFGLVSLFLIETLRLGKLFCRRAVQRIRMPDPAAAFIAGCVLVALTFVFSKDYLGLGVNVIHSLLEGGDTPWYSFLMKSIFTSITLNFGGSGGIVTPIYFVGASAGNLFARITGLDGAAFAAIGLVSVLAGAANTPIAASILAVELFGAAIAPYAAVASVISFIMSGHRSVYSTQLLAMKKSSSIDIPIGAEVEGLKAGYLRREKSLFSALSDAVRVLKESIRRK